MNNKETLSSWLKLVPKDKAFVDLVQCFSEDEFLETLQELYKKACDETMFRKLYRLRNTLYNEIAKEHKTTLYQYNGSLAKSFTLSSEPKVVLTMTSCKRFDLLQRTINSMIENISDISSQVAQWIVVDDNSSESDRQLMKIMYPFITWIFKGPAEKGHPRSMNMILDLVKQSGCKYHFHVEDDWEFFIKDRYIERCIRILNENPNYGQALVNIDYTEDQKTANDIWGSQILYTNSGERYALHRHFTGQQLDEESKKVGCANNLYWPHFSLRVGVTKTQVYDSVGKFNENAQHFEMEYAQRYVAKGFKTAFLDGIHTTHIGRRTYERKSDKLNSYDLNKEKQFGETPRESKTSTAASQPPGPVNIHVEINVINLERRRDRLVKFFKQNNKHLPGFKVFDAIDGKTLKHSQKLQKLFVNGDYKFRRGIVGCAYSHIKLWKDLVSSNEKDYMIILEDDVRVVDTFFPKLINLLQLHPDVDVLFLHWNPYPHLKESVKSEYREDVTPTVKEMSKDQSFAMNMGSGAGYVLTKKGAYNLLRQLNEKGCVNAIDWEIMKSGEYGNKIAYSSPMMVFADCYQNGALDTEIQTVYETITTTSEERVKAEVEYWTGNKLKVRKCETLPDSIHEVMICPLKHIDIVERRSKEETFLWYTTGTSIDDKIIVVPWKLVPEKFVAEKTLGTNLVNEVNP
jgi:GR25 family glycosyltransferase involved in LPS biosynthesis